jgi:hypothetical protein
MKKLPLEKVAASLSIVSLVMGGILWLSRIHFIADAGHALAKEVSHEQQKANHDTQALLREVVETKTDVKWIKRRLEGGSNY